MRALQVLAWMSKRADGLGGGLNRVKPEFSANQQQGGTFDTPRPKPRPLSPRESQIKTEKALERQPNMGPSYPSLTPKAMPAPTGYAPNIDPRHQELFDMHKKELSEWANARTQPQLVNTSAKAYMRGRERMNNHDMDWDSAIKNQENLYNLQNAGVIPKSRDNAHPSSIFNDFVRTNYNQRNEYLNDGITRYYPEFSHEYLQPQGRYTNQMHELNALWQKGIKARNAPLIPHEQRAGR